MFNELIEEFSAYVHTHYFSFVKKEDWDINQIHKTSVAFGFKPHLLGKDFNDNQFTEHKALFMFVWNEFDQMIYVNMERYFDNDIDKFVNIYDDFINFLKEKEFEALVSVFCYDHFSTIKDMEKHIPLSYTGEKSQKIYQILETFPTFKENTPVLHINFDGVSYNDWDSKFFNMNIDMEHALVEVFSIEGEKVSSLTEQKEAKAFSEKFLV